MRRPPSSAAMKSVFFLSSSLFSLAVQAAVSVLPSNNTQDLAGSASSANFRLWGANYLDGQHLAPLTQGLLNLTDAQAKSIYIAGDLIEVTNSNSLGLQSSQIGCIPCDSSYYAGNLGVDWTVESVVQALRKPAAIILYSTSASHCTISTDAPTDAYRNVFTVTDHGTAIALQKAFNSPNTSVHISEMSSFSTTNLGGSGGTAGDSPNTAMIILYSITGIITALFLGIIITGAVRAHRHPERYGPRRVAGRPRQSRARGIARAMLDGIPIVKFGDNNTDGVEAAKRDVEMASTDDPAREHPASGSEENVTAVGQTTTPRETELPIAEARSDRPTVAPEPNPNHAPDGGNFSCPICTDDFIRGQDLRVLPCNHQFHPECIDPWLVNVSGTCPLCRIDLNPPKEENAEEGENAENNEETPADTPATDAATSRHSRRLTNYLNARRMHNASVEERLAALRRVREANQDDADELAGARSSRSRLTSRLRERFRIRTRAHGAEGPTPVGSGTATPTVPAPAHVAPTSDSNE